MITEVGTAREILELKEMRARWHNAIRALVRDELNPAVKTWKLV